MIKAILCQGLYPNFAVADAGNAGRPSNERQYVTRSSGGLFMSPSSVLNCQDFGIAASIIGDTSGGRGGSRRGSATSEASKSASGGAAARAGRSDGLLCYGSLMETQKPFLASVTPLPALQALLLFSARIDTSEDASLVSPPIPLTMARTFGLLFRHGERPLLVDSEFFLARLMDRLV